MKYVVLIYSNPADLGEPCPRPSAIGSWGSTTG